MWWIWQQADLPKRKKEYSGPAARNSTIRASLSDTIPLGDLAMDIEVADIVSTEEGILCYRY